jgi:antitoxin PrlF
MSTGTMTSKGQITIPKDVREALGLTPGTKVTFTATSEGTFVLSRPRRPVIELEGALRQPGGRAVSLEEMDAAVAAAASKRDDA